MATVELEVSFDPTTVYFRNMNRGEERNQRVHLKNTSNNLLLISSVDPDDEKILVDLINRTPDWPLELKHGETLDILVTFRYQLDKPRFSKLVKINYKGGEGNVAHLRLYATLKRTEPKKPQEQPKPLPKDLRKHKEVKPESVKTSPSKEKFPMPPPPPDMPPEFKIKKPKEKAPE